MSEDLVHQIKPKTAILAATLTATGNGIVIDTSGYESLTFLIQVGDFATFDGTNYLTFKVQEGDLADGSDMADVSADDYIGGASESDVAWDRVFNAAAEDEETYKLGVRMNTKRYKRLVVTEAGTVSVILAAIALLDHPRHQPAGATQTP
jgi:hypothetical protein